MAITQFVGPPGSGKSHGLVKDVIVPAVIAGRRVLSNVDGLNPDAILAYCLTDPRVKDATKLGLVEVFHGDEALKPGFFPDEQTPDTATRVKAGDLLVFDEWALTFPRRGKMPDGCNVEGFLRWHRHLTGANGMATDVAIGTQVPADVNQNFRPLITTTYQYRKLSAIGAQGTYAWFVYQGHLTPKNGYYQAGTGKYDKAVFPLYKSSAAAADGTHVEVRTNNKETIWHGWKPYAVIAAPVVLLGGAFYGLTSVRASVTPPEATATANGAAGPVSGAPSGIPAPAPVVGPWRIVGTIQGDTGTVVVLGDEKGSTRLVGPEDFEFKDGRAVRGTVDGRTALAEDRLPVAGPRSLAEGMGI